MSPTEQAVEKAYDDGYDDGYELGYSDGESDSVHGDYDALAAEVRLLLQCWDRAKLAAKEGDPYMDDDFDAMDRAVARVEELLL
jgi:hypothetical protein